MLRERDFLPLSPPPPTKENALRAFACRALETIARIGAMEEDESACSIAPASSYVLT